MEPLLFSGRITNCYDSHVHWRATGGHARRLNLRGLRSPEAVRELNPQPENHRGDWLMGFGWDHNLFSSKEFPTREILDAHFGSKPVYFTRVDGHAAWVNTAALKRAGLWQKNLVAPSGGKVLLGADDYPTGIFIDHALQLVARHLPAPTLLDVREDLLSAQKVFHRAGFTHIRDLTCDEDQWQAASDLEAEGHLQLAVEQFFSADDPKDFAKSVELCMRARGEKHSLLRPRGVKVYFDGALGSEGAWISAPYKSGSGHGLQLLDEKDLAEMMRTCFEKNLDFAVHVIGDEAAHRVAQVANQLKGENCEGRLHLEHAQLLRPETLVLLRNIKVICHMQPCHWLSDKVWLEKKIGSLIQHAFRWRDLESAEIPYFFGSDTPIEDTSLQRNFNAVYDAHRAGIQLPVTWTDGIQTRAHSHPDLIWCLNTYTEFKDGRPIALRFLDRAIDLNSLN